MNDDETITRIEFTNGDVLDATETVTEVVEQVQGALAPVTECLGAVRTSAFQRTD
ncbi:MAG TPA: hypothetical protein VGJ81_00715 [Thermoanaerobaculia bacterium]